MKSLVDDVVKVAGMTDEAKIIELKKVAQESVADKMAKSKPVCGRCGTRWPRTAT